uniref:FACT complex subunit SSRP1 n=1 Tax=Steinernema glaseri TaxID=37863 RepID=A0A1I7ZYX9_9BILA
MAQLEFSDIFMEEMGALNKCRLKLSEHQIHVKNQHTGKLTTINASDVEEVTWVRLGNKPGFRVMMKNGLAYRFGGFKDTDQGIVKEFSQKHWNLDCEPVEVSIKGWNYGRTEIKGQSMEFVVQDKTDFEIPLSNVSNCRVGKQEATVEFHVNDDCPVSLVEMRLHIPQDPDAADDVDPVEEFRKAVMRYAGIEAEADQPICILPQILCTTPRGRYDIKVFPTYLSLHGKTYDYKIPIKTITRMFLLPHRDGRHMFFVLNVNPPIRQGQTRYNFLVLEFAKEEEMDIQLALTDQQLAEYGGKLEKNLSGAVYENVASIFRVMVNMRITVPGKFLGHSGTSAIVCAHKQASGFLYPLEKGFLYIHKPPMYIRFEEVSTLNFARSDVSTRSFDFEIDLKNGTSFVFNSVEKDEYNRLFDFVQQKGMRIRNAKRAGNLKEDKFAGSDDEIDPYKEAVKAEGKERLAGVDDDSDSDDEDYDVEADGKKMREEASSSEGSGSEPDEEYDSNAGDDSDASEVSDDLDMRQKQRKLEAKTKKKSEKSEKKEKKERAPKDGDEKKRKKKKDPNAPKKAMTAYFLWLNDNRPNIRKEGDTVTDTAKRAGTMWKELSAEDRAPYEKQAQEDKRRYEREMKEFKAGGGASTSTP